VVIVPPRFKPTTATATSNESSVFSTEATSLEARAFAEGSTGEFLLKLSGHRRSILSEVCLRSRTSEKLEPFGRTRVLSRRVRSQRRNEVTSRMKSAMGPAIRQFDLLLRTGSVVGLSDEELLERVVSPDRALASVAFEALVKRHGPMVLASCRGVLRNEHDAEDAFQATFLVMARRAGSLRSRECLGPWLHRVALRAAGRARVAAARRRDREVKWAESMAMVQPQPDWDAEREELRRAIHQEVDRLPKRYRVVVVLCDLQCESYETAAARLRVPVGTIRSRLSRARERLRGQVTRRGLALPVGLATALLATREATAALPASLIASTAKLANLAMAGGLAAGSGSAAAAYAHGVLKAGSFVGLGKSTAIITLIGVGVACTGATVFVRGAQRAIVPVTAPAQTVAKPTDEPDSTRPDSERLTGLWVIIEAEQNGAPLDIVIGDRLVIEGNHFAWTAARGEPERIFRRGTTRGTIALDPGAAPACVDLHDSGRVIPTIYRLEADGDRLRLCVGDPDFGRRPQTFSSEPGTRRLSLVFRRDPPSSPSVRRDVSDGGASREERP
jgi:RNA polymerase sigma factor (sigma-70 family)